MTLRLPGAVAAGLCLLAGLPAACFAAEKQAAGREKLILFTAGRDGHGKGHHEVAAALRLLRDCIDRSPGVKGVRTEFREGWPQQEDAEFAKLVERTDCFVFKGDGFPIGPKAYPGNPALFQKHRAMLEAAMSRGAGIVLLHYAAGSGDRKDRLGEWAGGYFCTTGPSKLAGGAQAVQVVRSDERHPVARGWESFGLHDEFYYDYWNGGAAVDDVRSDALKPVAHIVLKTEKQPEPARKTVAWTFERKDGGRAFATWASHWFLNWRHDGLRRMTLNGIVWAAGLEVPEKGVESELPADLSVYQPKSVRGSGYKDWPGKK